MRPGRMCCGVFRMSGITFELRGQAIGRAAALGDVVGLADLSAVYHLQGVSSVGKLCGDDGAG